MDAKPVVLVTGATGAQGGGVARHLLTAGRWRVRCLTRKPDSAAAVELRRLGAEVVAGDLDDAASLRAAAAGCHGVFGVTNFWEHFTKEKEQGMNLVDAVKAAGVEHFIFSTLPAAKKLSGGELDVPHFDIKAELAEYALEMKLPVTLLHVAFYYENFTSFFPPQKQADGTYTFGFPQGDTALAAVCVEDAGGVVAALFARGLAKPGEIVGAVGDDMPPQAYADEMSRAVGAKVIYQHVPREVFARYGFPGADDLANMFDFNRRFIPDRKADLARSRQLYPEMRTFAAWAAENRDLLLGAFG